MEGEGGDVGLVPLEIELGRSDRDVQLISIGINGSFLNRSLGHFLQILDLLL